LLLASSMWNLWRKFKADYLLSEEELGKKDDDHKLPSQNASRPNSLWLPARAGPRKMVKRLLILLLVVGCVYYLFRNLPSDFNWQDYGPQLGYPRDPREYDYILEAKSTASPISDTGAKIGKERKIIEGHAYNGPVKFHKLSQSLHAIFSTKGTSSENKNVLFAAASIRSAAELLPLACQMGTELRSYVHFALMSRSEIDLEELKSINGIHEDCQIIFHGTIIP
jgi:hypothetical protein